MFSFGDFQFSRGGTSDPKKVESSKLFNEVSYFQAFKDVRFFNSTIKSIGLEIGTDTENTDFEGLTSCLNYRGCNREYVTTRTEAETLLSFEGNVFGVNGEVATESDLVIDNINSLETDQQYIISNIVNNFISKNRLDLVEYYNIDNWLTLWSTQWSTFTYEFRLSNVEVVSDVVKGEVWLYTGFKSKPSNWRKGQPWSEDYEDLTKLEYTQPYKFSVNWKEIYNETLSEKEFGGTSYTLNQLEAAAERYLSFTGMFKTVKEAEEYERERLKVGINTPEGSYPFRKNYLWVAIDTSGDETVNIVKNSNRIELVYEVLASSYPRQSSMIPDDEWVTYQKVQLELSVLEKFIPHDYLGDEIKNKKVVLNRAQQVTAIKNLLRTIIPEGVKRSVLVENEGKFARTVVYESHKVNGNNVTINFKRIYPILHFGYSDSFNGPRTNYLEYKKINDSIVVTQGQLSHYLAE